MTGLEQKDIDAIRDGTWEVQCPTMKLSLEDESQSYEGSGVMRQDENKRLVFTLVQSSDHPDVGGIFRSLVGQQSTAVGQLIPKSQYYTLHAVADSGDEWISTPTVDVGVTHNLGNNNSVINGELWGIRQTKSHAETANLLASISHLPVTPYCKRPRIVYYIRGTIGNFPCNTVVEIKTLVAGQERTTSCSLCAAKVDALEYSCELISHQGRITFSAVMKKDALEHPAHIQLRFIEALQFVLGCPVDYYVMEIHYNNNSEIHVEPAEKNKTIRKMLSPIAFNTSDSFPAFWELFQKYMSYVSSYPHNEWHPISRRIYTLHHGMSSIWPIAFLTAGVEVEGLLLDEFDKKIPPPPALVVSVNKVLQLIDDFCDKGGTDIDSESRQRIGSSLGHVKNHTSAKNKLRSLLSQNIIRKEDIDAWDIVRNKSAHAVASETGISQENLLKLNSVLVLFYHMVFHIIGYQGEYTDYGVLGFPTRAYPQ